MAFVSAIACHLRAGRPSIIADRTCSLGLRHLHTSYGPVARPVRRPRDGACLRMQGDERNNDAPAKKADQDLPAAGVKTKAQEAEDSVEQTWWGLASFILIIAVMSLGMVATLARDFFPGGLAPPIQ